MIFSPIDIFCKSMLKKCVCYLVLGTVYIYLATSYRHKLDMPKFAMKPILNSKVAVLLDNSLVSVHMLWLLLL